MAPPLRALAALLLSASSADCARLAWSAALRVEAEAHAPRYEHALEYTRVASRGTNDGEEVSVNTTLLAGGKMGYVRASVTGCKDTQDGGWVLAAYAGDLKDHVPVKYLELKTVESFVATGSAVLDVRLINHGGAPTVFHLLKNGLSTPESVATSDAVRFENPNAPNGGHLALMGGQHLGDVLVQWQTSKEAGANQRLEWGVEPGKYSWSAPAQTTTYTRDDMCGGRAKGEAWIDPGLLHAAAVTNLGQQPGLRVYYRFGGVDTGFSEEFSFAAPPAPGSAIKAVAIADVGVAEPDGWNLMDPQPAPLNTTAGVVREVRDGAQLVIHNGDISYARGYVAMWNTFFYQMEPFAAAVPYMTTIGNHERDWKFSAGTKFNWPNDLDSNGECGVAYEKRLQMPTPALDKPWYSFDYGAVHFVQISTEHPFHRFTEQHRFVAEDLAKVDRSRTPWVVFGGHRPIYLSSTGYGPHKGDQTVAKELVDSFEHLWVQYGVDLTLTGHHHSYQRSCPVVASKCIPPRADGSNAAPVHLVIGNGGAHYSTDTDPNKPAYMEVVELIHGYLRFHANATTFAFEAVSGATGEVFDRARLVRPGGA